MKAETLNKNPEPAKEAPIDVVKRRMRGMVQLWHDTSGTEPRFLVAVRTPRGDIFFAEIEAFKEVLDDFVAIVKVKTGKKITRKKA